MLVVNSAAATSSDSQSATANGSTENAADSVSATTPTSHSPRVGPCSRPNRSSVPVKAGKKVQGVPTIAVPSHPTRFSAR